MAPKTTKDTNDTDEKADANGKPTGSKTTNGNRTSSASKKRKNEDEKAKSPAKASRRSARGPGAQNGDPIKLINFLLSEDALKFCRPKNESEDLEARGSEIRTYSSGKFTPFEELICALILSRPISHALGLRSIRTLLNEPYNLTTPKAIKAAGKDGVWEALDKARTQHKGKTAEEIFLLADSIEQHLGKDANDVQLQKLREEAEKTPEKERDALKKHVKGLAKTGIEIFTRRIQTEWEEFYPFADDRVVQALDKLGIVSDVKVLIDHIDKNWEKLDKDFVTGNEAEKKRILFSKVLERALAADLEGNTDEVKDAAKALK